MTMSGYNFTERVRKVLAYAREEAAQLQHEYVGTEHILLGLVREGEGVASTTLENLGIDQSALRNTIETTVKRGTAGRTGPDLPYTSRAKKVLEFAMKEARELNHTYVGTEHLLLGLIVEGKGIAAQVLVEAGATLEVARNEVLRILGSADSEYQAAEPPIRRRPAVRKSAEPTSRPMLAITDRARRVLARANDIAAERGSATVSGAHVAIALLAHGEGVANAALDRFGVDVEALAADLQMLAPKPGEGEPVSPETVLTLESALNDMITTLASARAAGSGPPPNTGDLILSVFSTTPEVAQVFGAHGVRVDLLRAELSSISG